MFRGVPLTAEAIVYAANVSALSLPLSLDALSPERREKIERMKNDSDKRLSLGAEMLLRYGLKNAGFDKFPPELSYNEHGKPYLKDSGIFFNISHSGDFAVCAVSDCDLGCDIEKMRPVGLRIARRFCAEEYDSIMSAKPEEQSELLFRYWTLKESFMKAVGRGFSLGLDEFRIVINDEISVVQSVDEGCFSFREFDEIKGCKCAVCLADAQCAAELKIVDLNSVIGVK